MTNQPNINPFDIPDEEMRFGSDSDVFKRENFAKQLLKIVNDMPGERVILLEAPWGEGKTVFAKMFQNHLNEQEYRTIYYDVFAHDYYEQPLLPFMEEIYQLIDKEKKWNRKKIEEAKKLLYSATKPLMKDFINVSTGCFLTNTIGTLFDKINESKNDLNKLKKYLTALPDNIDKPIIFIVDELDRCKPTYALEMLEIIKHLFSVPNIVFILIANSEQLCQSIKHKYGNDIDAYNYLHKFIHLRIALPKQNKKEEDKEDKEKKNTDNANYIEYCIDKLEFNLRDISEVEEIFIEFSEHYQLSFREIERYILTFKIMLTVLDMSNRQGYDPVLYSTMIFISIIKNKFPNSYIKLSNKSITFQEFITEVNIDSVIEKKKYNFLKLGGVLKLHLDDNIPSIYSISYDKSKLEFVNDVIKSLNNLHLS